MSSKLDVDKECLHIFSAGRSVDSTFIQAVKRYRIDTLVILKTMLGKSESDKKEDMNIENSIRLLRSKAKEIGVATNVITVSEDNANEIRDEILRLKGDFPDAEFYFNITGGKKILSLNLFTMAVWIDAIVYYVDINENILEFTIPRIHSDNLDPNGSYFSILSILFSLSNQGKQAVLYSEVYEKLSEIYRPSTQRSKGKYPKLRRGTFSKLVRYLIEHSLIEEEYKTSNHRNKLLKLTHDGVFTFNFINRNRR
ncbi:MAG: hypothetical protein ACYCSO_04860 [Cuniculiplasma sp.]|nr:MAG: hypothetical protein AMDU5_GPLC00015G0003 [Thermoplasmatales archaeon Gpl]